MLTRVVKKNEIEKYEKSKYHRFSDGPYRLFVSLELEAESEVVHVEMKRFLGAPDFKVFGLIPAVFSRGMDAGPGGGLGARANEAERPVGAPVAEV